MAQGYKIRLADGSEIGPMNVQSVKDWYTQGLVGKDDLVLKPGSNRWIPLRSAINLDDARRPASPAGASDELKAAVRAAVRPRENAPARTSAPAAARPRVTLDVQQWRTVLAGAVLLAAAGGAAFFAFRPDFWIPSLDAAPWTEIALGLTALGLLLVRGWEAGRKVVRIVAILAALALFPLTGILLAQGVRGAGLAVLGAAFLFLGGLFAVLAGGWLPGLRVALGLVILLAGGVGIGYFGLAPASPQRQAIRSFAAADRGLADPASGVALDLPRGWVALRPEQDLVTAPAGTRAVVAQERLAGFGWLAAEASARGPRSLDGHLDQVLRVRALPGRAEVGREDVTLGTLVGRRVNSTWETGGRRYRDVVVGVKDGGTWWTLAAWLPDDGSDLPSRELTALVDAFSLSGVMAKHLDEALQKALRDVPHLTAVSAEAIMARSEAQALEPAETFRRGYELASRGLSALTPAEAQELGALTAAAAGGLTPKDRARLTAYLERVREGRITVPAEDAEMAGLMKTAVLRLAPPRLTRLQALYEKAIRAAAAAG